MNHGVSLRHIDNSAIQEAIKNKAHPDRIARLKGNVAFNCVYGFEYFTVPFNQLGNLLTTDVGFNNFKFKEVAYAIYDKDKHPDAYGRVRGMGNIVGGCTWICFDVDVTTISDIEMHEILSNVNHHIARTSDPDNPYKMRVIVELSKTAIPTRKTWKYFLGYLADALGLGVVDKIPMSQVIYGYKGRTVLSVTDKSKIDPTNYLDMATMQHNAMEERNALHCSNHGDCDRALETPYTTFDFAYNAAVGDRWATAHAAIHKAKELGASREYIVDLMYKINDFLDDPKPRNVIDTTLISAI